MSNTAHKVELIEYSYTYTPAVFDGNTLVREGFSDEVRVTETTSCHGVVVARSKEKLRVDNTNKVLSRKVSTQEMG